MDIYLSSFPRHTVSFFKESVLPPLTARSKKILAIALIALGSLVACAAYVVHRCRKAKVQNDQEKGSNSTAAIAKDRFENETLNGKRKITRADGTIEEGDFQDGKLHGQGKKQFFLLGWEIVEEGQFVNGNFNRGKRISQIGKWGEMVEEGQFAIGNLNGQGKKIDSEGVREGQFKDGLLNGTGKITWHDGTVEKGKFQNERLHGKGTRTYPDGKVEKGQFANGKFNG